MAVCQVSNTEVRSNIRSIDMAFLLTMDYYFGSFCSSLLFPMAS